MVAQTRGHLKFFRGVAVVSALPRVFYLLTAELQAANNRSCRYNNTRACANRKNPPGRHGYRQVIKVYVDADACPKPIKEILFRLAERTGIAVIFVANHNLMAPRIPSVRCVQVGQGFDVADDFIVQQVRPGDLVITADIPLAADIIDCDASALNPRGELYTRANVRARLNMRDFFETMRASGIHSGGAAPLSQRDRMDFANALDRYVAQHYHPSDADQ